MKIGNKDLNPKWRYRSLYAFAVLDPTLSVFVEQGRVAEYIEEQTCCVVEAGVKYWSCCFCEKYNRDKRDIQRHIEAAHIQTSPYICSFCNSQFKNRRSLQRHETAMHKWVCAAVTTFLFQFSWSSTKLVDMLRNSVCPWSTLEGWSSGPVAFATRRWTTSKIWWDMLRAFMWRPVPIFVNCATMLNSKQSVAFRDIQMLTIDKDKDNLVVNFPFSVYMEQDKVLAYIEDHASCQVDGRGTRFWSCGICQRSLSNKSQTHRHIESYHIETDPYPCLLCCDQFTTRRALQRHTTAMHNMRR